MAWSLALAVFIILLCPSGALAIDVTVTGNWSDTVNAFDLQAGAGSDLVSTYTSDAAHVSLSVSTTTGDTDNWRIDVRRSDTVWLPGTLRLYVKRTGDGMGAGTVSGGQTFHEVTTIDQAFFQGAGDRSSIPIQLQLDGMSVQVAPATYSTSLIFTVVDVL